MGVSVPGVVKWPEGIVDFSPQLNLKNYPLRTKFGEKLNHLVIVDNNVRAAASAENLFGTLNKNNSFLVMQVGTGLGTALFINGEV